MLAPEQPTRRMTREEYLAFESEAESKHEFHDGEVVAMVGASYAHAVINANLVALLSNGLRGRGCRPLSNDLRVRVPGTGLYAYPDVPVVCGEPRFEPDVFDTLVNPVVIFEVLSPSTERYDRGRKFGWYRALESLREYVLVAQDAHHVEWFSRQEGGLWTLREAKGLDGTVRLASLDAALALRDIYDGVDLSPADSGV